MFPKNASIAKGFCVKCFSQAASLFSNQDVEGYLNFSIIVHTVIYKCSDFSLDFTLTAACG